jgi:two-component system, NarL family, nitrate/nitrite response regulator NarL
VTNAPGLEQPKETVLVVDDHPIVRRGMTALLQHEAWVAGTIEADTVAGALALARAHRPGVAVLDLNLPDGDGIALTSELIQLLPGCSVLILTMNADPERARAALAAGAAGFLLKETDPAVVVGALHTVARGGLVVGPHLDRRDLISSKEAGAAPGPFARLSPRELQIVAQLAEGASNASIARRLGLAEKTVRNQVSTILTKIGAADRVQAALLARDHGLDTQV